jgi:hypothetical protein
LDALLPPEFQQRLLFVWSQAECTVQPKKMNMDMDTNDGSHSHHHQQQQHDHPNSVIFEKHLPKVWERFPLWNADNTLLMDDSPDKCPHHVANAIHPPPIHGQWRPPLINNHDNNNHNDNNHNDNHHNHNQYNQQQQPNWQSDEDNEQQQQEFFHQWIQFWHEQPFERIIHDNDNNDEEPSSPILQNSKEIMKNQRLFQHLERYGTGHMGWRGNHSH